MEWSVRGPWSRDLEEVREHAMETAQGRAVEAEGTASTEA